MKWETYSIHRSEKKWNFEKKKQQWGYSYILISIILKNVLEMNEYIRITRLSSPKTAKNIQPRRSLGSHRTIRHKSNFWRIRNSPRINKTGSGMYEHNIALAD